MNSISMYNLSLYIEKTTHWKSDTENVIVKVCEKTAWAYTVGRIIKDLHSHFPEVRFI